MIKNKLKINSGYTIIETMVAVSIFLVVVSISMNSLLNANLLLNKSKDMRSVMDNLSFIMEDMSRNLRTGYDYRCQAETTYLVTPLSCISGGTVSFTEAISNTRWVYKISSTDLVNYNIFKSVDGGATFVKLNDDFIKIKPQSGFSVSGAESIASGDNKQPFITIKLIGEIHYKNIITPFSLQTSVSQTKIDIL